jgi:hypothetical protein
MVLLCRHETNELMEQWGVFRTCWFHQFFGPLVWVGSSTRRWARSKLFANRKVSGWTVGTFITPKSRSRVSRSCHTSPAS